MNTKPKEERVMQNRNSELVDGQMTNIRLPRITHERLRRLSFESRVPMAVMLREAVETWLDSQPVVGLERVRKAARKVNTKS